MLDTRYVVCSVTGYTPGASQPQTSYWVADSWYGYRVIAPFYAWDNPRRSHGARALVRRTAAEKRCAELNREHEEWLAAA